MRPAAINRDVYNSIINKTAISARTNRKIGGDAPSKYLPALEHAAAIQRSRMDEIISSHCIAPERLRTDDFWGFYAARAEALLQRIEAATGKQITRAPELFCDDAERIAEIYDDGLPEWDTEEAVVAIVP